MYLIFQSDHEELDEDLKEVKMAMELMNAKSEDLNYAVNKEPKNDLRNKLDQPGTAFQFVDQPSGGNHQGDSDQNKAQHQSGQGRNNQVKGTISFIFTLAYHTNIM